MKGALFLKKCQEVDIWHADLRSFSAGNEDFSAVLSTEEKERAGRFRSREGRNHFLIGRGLLRVILGRYLDSEPVELTFLAGPDGKPFLATPGARDLCFNLSHSRDRILYAVARGKDVGVDIEYIRNAVDRDRIAGRFFSSRERKVLKEAPAAEKNDVFFRLWACKEAFAKAKGEGIRVLPQSFDVSGVIEKPIQEIRLEDGSLQMLSFFPGYAAAVAVSTSRAFGTAR